MKKLIVLSLTVVLALGALFGVFLSPFHASALRLMPFSTPDHEVIAYYSVTNLPRRNAYVGDAIIIPQKSTGGPNAYFKLVRTSGARDVVIGRSDDMANMPTHWENPGDFEYRFFMNSALTGEHFHYFGISVTQNEFSFALPTNSEDILPNVSVPGLPITLPLPSSFVDRHGRDLFEVRRNRERQLYVPNLTYLERLYPNVTSHADYLALDNDFDRLHMLQMAVFADTRVHFFGNAELQNANNATGETLAANWQAAIADPARRTFTPDSAGSNFYAEFIYENSQDDITVASFRTHNILVDNVGANWQNIIGEAGTPRNEQIRFEFNPSVDFVPTNLRLNVESTLPHPSVSLSRATEGVAYNPVHLNADTVTNFTFVRVEIMPDEGPRVWRPARTPEWQDGHTLASHPDSFFHNITDFNFIPTERGEYRFWYYTTTIFGAGYDHAGDQIVTVNGQRFIRYNPFGPDPRFFIRFSTVAPEMRWTDAFAYDDVGNATTIPNIIGPSDPGNYYGTPIQFEFANDRSRYLPGRGANARTQISQEVILQDLGDQDSHRNEHLLRIPALLGDTSGGERSGNLIYTLTIQRFLLDQPSPNSVTFSSEVRTAQANGAQFHWDNTTPLVINFATMAFSNGYIHDGSNTTANTGVLTGSESLAPNGDNRIARYQITVIVRDTSFGDEWQGLSTQERFSFNVVARTNYRMHADRPEFHGGIQLRQANYYQNDTIAFRQVNVSDHFTDTVNIDVQYFIHYESDTSAAVTATTGIANGPQFIDITDKVEIVGGEVRLPLVRDGSLVALDMLESIPASGILRATIIAVARNYFALKNDFQFVTAGFPTADQPYGIGVETVEIRIFSEEYGSAVNIFGAQGAWMSVDGDDQSPTYQQQIDNGNWDLMVNEVNDPINGGENPTFLQNRKVFLPQFFLNYTVGTHRSSISFSVTQPNSSNPLQTNQGGPQLTIPTTTYPTNPMNPDPSENAFEVISTMRGTYDNPIDDRIYFLPRESGIHTITMLVTNNGGNISVFVATILIRAIAHPNVEIVGGTETMRVGQAFPLPTISVSVNGEEFTSNDNQQVMGHDGTNPVVIASYRITPRQTVHWEGNNFAPRTAGRFVFDYEITIFVDRLADVGLTVAGDDIVLRREHVIIVNQLTSTDFHVNLMRADYVNLRNRTMGTGTYVDRPYINSTGGISYANELVEIYNMPLQFASPGITGGTTRFPISDDDLRNGLREVPGVTGQWEYGFIFLPDWQTVMTGSLNRPLWFSSQVESYITVRGPERTGQEILLDTSDDNFALQYVIDPVTGQQLHFFQPVGRLDNNDGTGQRVNRDIFVDGEYTVRYTAIYQGIETHLEFVISIGDIAQARIYFTTVRQEQVFGRVYTIGEEVIIDSNDIMIDPNGSRTNFTRAFVAINTQFSLQVGNNVITEGTGDNQWQRDHQTEADIRAAGDGSPTGGRQIWRFVPRVDGEFTVTLQITSEAGVTTSRNFRINVEAPEPSTTITPTEIWGWVLIVLSSGVLLAVIIYFIKTGRDTKFAGNNKKAKGKETEKIEKPDQV
ncbi:MAG: hypothetical protein FWE45_04220 [Firmicutes bacterium]|nr:hypothetical protein [Bacillota bacterium]